MFKLTLTSGERKAIDWVGGRYATGYDLYHLLWCECHDMNEDEEWDSEEDIIFNLPYSQQAEFYSLCEQEEFLFPCFGPTLVDKLWNVCCGLNGDGTQPKAISEKF